MQRKFIRGRKADPRQAQVFLTGKLPDNQSHPYFAAAPWMVDNAMEAVMAILFVEAACIAAGIQAGWQRRRAT
ncbi:hypothetical protein [Paraburkholderia youngii]|uniref:hypothetical protein n=1 Tax=Paraburkholderia youngii TaxID=2782701 RepID=UPI003D235095